MLNIKTVEKLLNNIWNITDGMNDGVEVLRPSLVVVVPVPYRLKKAFYRNAGLKYDPKEGVYPIISLDRLDHKLAFTKPGISTRVFISKEFLLLQVEEACTGKVLMVKTIYRDDKIPSIDNPFDLKYFLMVLLNVGHSIKYLEDYYVNLGISGGRNFDLLRQERRKIEGLLEEIGIL
jgi:hypothetical protein